MKIAHISLFVDYYSGLARTCEIESLAASELKNIIWDVYVLSQNERYARGNIIWIPLYYPFYKFFTNRTETGNLFLYYLVRVISFNHIIMRIKFNLFVNRLTKRYDFVLVRYNSADFFAWLFLRRKERIIFMHHSKHAEELKLRSYFAHWIEKLTGPFQMRKTYAVCAVTPEIAEFETERCKIKKRYLVFPNGVFPLQEDRLKDNRGGKIKIVMSASEYFVWHGLDEVMEKMRDYQGDMQYEFHLIGRLNDVQSKEVKDNENIHYHGELDHSKLIEIYSYCDIGLSSIRVDRKKLRQTSTLKVRDYFSYGLPVVVGNQEPAFPKDFNFLYSLRKEWKWEDLLEFATKARIWSRQEVFQAAKPYIDYKEIILRFVSELKRFNSIKSN